MKFLDIKLTQPLQIITTAGAPHSLLKNRIEKINPKEIVIATDMDTQGRQYAHSVETMMLKTNYSISTPIYNAKDLAELLQKLSKKPWTLILLTHLNPRFRPHFYFYSLYDAKVVFYIFSSPGPRTSSSAFSFLVFVLSFSLSSEYAVNSEALF